MRELIGAIPVGLFRALLLDSPLAAGEHRKREHRALLAADMLPPRRKATATGRP
jgi:hypothetical protein